MACEFPSELVDCILDNLWALDKTTLLNCAVAGRAWARSSQRIIFREIILKSPMRYRKTSTEKVYYSKLTASFDSNPSLALHVQSLELQLFMSTPEALDTAAASIIHRLSNVKKLSFYCVNWDKLSLSLREELIGMLRAPSLTHLTLDMLEISSFTKLASLLSQATHLRTLYANPSCQKWDVMGSILELDQLSSCSPPRSIQLQHLGLGGECQPASFMTWFQHESCSFDIRNLSSLEINRKIDLSVLQYFGANLRELDFKEWSLNPGANQMTYFGLFIHLLTTILFPEISGYLEHTPHLHKLHLQLEQSKFFTPVPSVKAIFEPLLSNHCPLQHLTIDLTVSHYINDPTILHWNQWTAIDTLLAKPMFSSLKSVVFNVKSLDQTETAKLLGNSLPFLKGSGKLLIASSQYSV